MQSAIKLIGNFENKYVLTAPVVYQITSCLLMSVFGFMNKNLTRIDSPQIVLIRALVMLSINSLLVYNLGLKVLDIAWSTLRKLAQRSIFGALGGMLQFQGIKYLPLSEGQVLHKTSPIWTSLIAVFILKTEKFTRQQVINSLLCFIGIILVSQPPFIFKHLFDGYDTNHGIDGSKHTLGVIFVLTSSFTSSLVQIQINSMSGQVHQVVILQYFCFFSALIAPLTAILTTGFVFVIPTYEEWQLLIMIGITSYFSQLLMNRSYLKGQLTLVSMAGQSQVVFGFLIDTFILGEPFHLISFGGTLLIMMSLFVMIKSKSKKVNK